jgi:hypothetical protein
MKPLCRNNSYISAETKNIFELKQLQSSQAIYCLSYILIVINVHW